jgi:PAS domain S-box-containing protein
MKRVLTLAAVLVFLPHAACVKDGGSPHLSDKGVRSYKDVPGITQEEIAAIEAVRAKGGGLTYGNIIETESFRMPDGTFAGFSAELFNYMGGFFGIGFSPRYYGHGGRDSVMEAFKSGGVDFVYGIATSAKAMERYHVTTPVAGHRMAAYMRAGDAELNDISGIAGFKTGFLKSRATREVISQYYPSLHVEWAEAATLEEAAEMLRGGEIDIFLTGIEADSFFEGYDFIRPQRFDSPVYVPVTIATAKDELAPLISAFNKYLSDAGGIGHVSELYEEMRTAQLKRKLYGTFTEEELAYIEDLKATKGGVVSIGFMHDAYPASFYNRIEKKYQGVAPEILTEVTKLTGIKFEETVTNSETSLAELIRMVKDGEISMATQVIYSESRKNDFIWSDIPYLSSKYALLSRMDFPALDKYQVYYHRVGVVERSVHAERFDLWFPNHGYRKSYATGNAAFEALEKDELCLVMLSENMLWAMTNYHGHVGYKINISFNDMQEARLGYNKSETHLRSIVDKAMGFIDIENIRDHWINRTFDYSKGMLEQRVRYMYTITVLAVAALLVLSLMFRKNKKLSKKLQHESAKLSTIFQAIPDIVFYMDTNLRYVSVNNTFKTFAGKTEEEVLGKTDQEVFPDQKTMTDYFTKINAEVLAERRPVTVQDLLISHDGAEVFLEAIKVPMLQDGELMGLICISRDITAHKEAEAKVTEASKEKSRFLASMSHEIRTPLNAIIGMSDLLSMERLSDRQQNYVKDVCMASHSLLSIVNDILDISKIEAGKLDLSPVDYDFREFVTNLVSMFKFMAQKKGLDFAYEDGGGLPKCLRGDDVRLRQVLINIFANAVNYTSGGRVDFKAASDDSRLTFVIRDTGIGIKPEDIENIFSPFKRVDSEKNRSVQGTGLGLPISKSFVEMMGGTIEVASVYGLGSTFTIVIPRENGDESKIKRADAGGMKVMFQAPDAKILVVDDNALNLKVAFRLLSLYNIPADLVPSGAEAIEAVQKTDYDIVFMDHMMPEMDGIEATAKIRELGGKFEKLTIIALTANATRGVQEIFLSSGMDDYVSKPIELDKLNEILKKWIPTGKISGQARGAMDMIVGIDHRGKSGDFWETVSKVGFINAEIGKNRVAGIEEMYREALDLLYGKLPQDCKNLEFFERGGDLQNFAILVHGMKSSLSTVGAMGLSEAAAQLEKASKAGDAQFCKDALPKLLKDLNELRARLANICGADEPQRGRPKGDGEYLRENVSAALNAAESYDGDAAVAALGKLLEYDYGAEKDEILKNAQAALKNFEFDEAAGLLKQIF